MKRFCLLGTIAAAALAVCCPPAGAADFQMLSCSQIPYVSSDLSGSTGWYPTDSTGKPHSSGSCPNPGLGFDTSQTVAQGATNRWSLALTPDANPLTTTNVSLVLSGGETGPTGYRYSLLGCATCAPFFVVPDDRPAGADPLIVSKSDVYVSNLTLKIECVAVQCGPAAPIALHDVSFTVHDTTPPVLSTPYVFSFWQKRAYVSAYFSASDMAGAGMKYASLFTEGGGAVAVVSTNCDLLYGGVTAGLYPFSRLCPRSISWNGYLTDALDGLKDGEHTLFVESQDAVGNLSDSEPVKIKLDDTRPLAPEDFATAAGDLSDCGWTPKDNVSLRWTNPADEPEAGQQSPLNFAWFTTQKVDAAGVPLGTESNQQYRSQLIASLPAQGFLNSVPLLGDGYWRFRVWVEDEVHNLGMKGKFTVKRDATTPQPPTVGALPWFNREALSHIPKAPVNSQSLAGLESGICGYATTINQTANSTPPAARTINGAVGEFPIAADTPAGHNYLHVRAQSGAGVWSDVSQPVDVRVDVTAPTVKVAGAPASGWTNGATALELTGVDGDESPVDDDLESGVASVTYRVDGGIENTVVGGGLNVQPPAGDHRVKYFATDVAGNAGTVEELRVQSDTTPPTASFDPRDPARPARLTGVAQDADSGIADAQIQYRRLDVADGGWHPLPSSMIDAQPDGSVPVSADIPDAQLPAGDYAFRIAVRDRAGNTAAYDQIGDTDLSMRAKLPLRVATTLTSELVPSTPVAAKCKKTKKQRACKSKGSAPVGYKVLSVKYGKKATLRGTLHAADGSALGGRPLTVFAAIGDRAQQPLQMITTDSAGNYSFPVDPGPNRRFTVEFAQSDQAQAASAGAELRVAAPVTLSVNRRWLRVGGSVRFRGRLGGAFAGFSPSGVPVTLEFLNDFGDPQTGPAQANANGLGGFTFKPYRRTSPVPKSFTLKFRAKVLSGKSDWPYDDGYSAWIAVRVRK